MPLAAGDGEVKISTAGGDRPCWEGDGRELFYIAASGAGHARRDPASGARCSGAAVGFHTLTSDSFSNFHRYDVAADRKRFIRASTSGAAAASPPIIAVVNWNARSKK